MAVVTGGGSGIGRAIARRYAAAGGKVVVLGRHEDPLKETVDLIQAAGNFVSPGESLSPNGWKSVIDIVLDGSFHATHAAAQHMLAAGSGSILNVIASCAWHGHPGTVHSAAAKGGIVAMTATLAVEWAARGVRVNCIAPGPTETEGAGKALWGSDVARARVQGGVPAGRFARPEDIAESAPLLMSDRADHITGEIRVVDGGQWLGKSVYTDEKAGT